MNKQDTQRRAACIIICATDGDVRAARGLVARAIRKTLDYGKQCTAPYYVKYMSTEETESYQCGNEPRYLLNVTEAEFQAIEDAIWEAAEGEGWNRPPVDMYQD